ncbi:RICIN domain-containing protein [Nonomuraea ferruginea]
MGVGASNAVAEAVPSATAGVAAVGSRLINGDGDTSGTCLEIEYGGTGTGVRMARLPRQRPPELALHHPHRGGYVAIRSHDPDQAGNCLSAGSVVSESPFMRDCTDGVDADMAWTQIHRSNGWFQLHSKAYQGLCLAVIDIGARDLVTMHQCGGATQGNQLWHWASVG